MRVGILADAGPASGYGHVSRTLTLAAALTRRGVEVALHSPELPVQWSRRLLDARVEPRLLPSDILDPERASRAASALASAARCDQWIIDHYRLPSDALAVLCREAAGVLRIEDRGNGPVCTEGIVCPLPRRAGFTTDTDERGSIRLFGPRYALLDALYRRARPIAARNPDIAARMLLSCGGSDPVNLTERVASALLETKSELGVDVVVGPGYAWRDSLARIVEQSAGRFRIHDSPEGLAALLLTADFALGAPGHTSWERACIGVPSLLAIQASNQEQVEEFLVAAGVARSLGQAATLDDHVIVRAIRSLAEDASARSSMSASARELVDGFGSERVADAMQHLDVREATSADARLLWGWANDPLTRSQSLQTAPIPWESHCVWLDDVLRSKDRTLLVGEVSGVPFAQCRLDRADDATTVSISVSSDHRGRKLSRPFLAAVLRERANDAPFAAQIRHDNQASLALFRGLGFGEDAPAGEGVLRLVCRRFVA